MNFRIYIKELKEKLNCKDTRTIKRWCVNNSVQLFCDFGSNKKYVMEDQFYLVYSASSNSEQDQIPRRPKYNPQGNHEKAYLSMLQNISRTL